METSANWLSRISLRGDVGCKQLVGMGEFDPYGQHRALWKLFTVAPEDRTERAEFLFRAERKGSVPVFYVLSRQQPIDRAGLWHIESKPYRPVLKQGDHLAFKLRVNPVVTRRTDEGKRRKRHDVVMDAKHQLNWKELSMDQRPALADIVQKAGVGWIQARAERLGCIFAEDTLRVDGYNIWRQAGPNGIELSTLDFDGTLTVKDPDRFVAALIEGIGPAKGFGCGLLLVRRV